MSDSVYYILCIVLAGLVLLGISMMSKVKTALWGNLLSCACMTAAIVLTVIRYDFSGKWLWLLVGLVPASIAGAILAKRVKMIEMPQTVAMLHGFGGAASALVAAVTLTDGKAIGAFEAVTAGIALVIRRKAGQMVQSASRDPEGPQKVGVARRQYVSSLYSAAASMPGKQRDVDPVHAPVRDPGRCFRVAVRAAGRRR